MFHHDNMPGNVLVLYADTLERLQEKSKAIIFQHRGQEWLSAVSTGRR